MKRLLYFILIVWSLSIMSCHLKPLIDIPPDYFAYINSDGTGFHKLIDWHDLPGWRSNLEEIYVTESENLIFAADRFYHYDRSTKIFHTISDSLTDSKRLAFGSNNQVYYCTNGDLFRYDLNSQEKTNLTNNYAGYLIEPIISPDNSIITLGERDSTSSATILCYYNLANETIVTLWVTGTNYKAGIYSSAKHKFYYIDNDGLNSIDFQGLNKTLLFDYTSLAKNFYGLSSEEDHLLFMGSDLIFRSFNLDTNAPEFSNQFTTNQANIKLIRNIPQCVVRMDEMILLMDNSTGDFTNVPNASKVTSLVCPNWDGSKIFYEHRENLFDKE